MAENTFSLWGNWQQTDDHSTFAQEKLKLFPTVKALYSHNCFRGSTPSPHGKPHSCEVFATVEPNTPNPKIPTVKAIASGAGKYCHRSIAVRFDTPVIAVETATQLE